MDKGIQIVSKNPPPTLINRFKGRDYRTYWQEYLLNFVISLGVLYHVRGTKLDNYILYVYYINIQNHNRRVDVYIYIYIKIVKKPSRFLFN